MRSPIKAAWDWLPVIVRAIVLGWVVLTIGSTVPFLPLFGNLKFHPEIPWAFPVTLIILAVYWAYFSGWGAPAATRETRQKLARASWPVSRRIWGAAIPAILFGIVALVAPRLLLPSLMPVRAPSVSISLSSYPLPTVIGALLSILLQPAYLFRHPEFIWKALSARPVWEGVASTFPERLLTIGRAMSPKHMFAGDPFQILSILASVLVISTLLTVFAFVNLLRAARSSAL